jgi:hypothetical protein
MAITVAPLTTVVMSSVDQDRAGTASGINNAVARVAGLLAVAVLGMVIFKAFASRLNHSLAHLSLPSGMVQEVETNEIKLAGLPAPAGLDPSSKAAVQASIRQAFVFGFRMVMLICAGLAAASAAAAWFMIPSRRREMRSGGPSDCARVRLLRARAPEGDDRSL